MREVACVGAAGTLLVVDRVANPQTPWLTLGAVQGPSATAPCALLSIVRDGLLSKQFSYRIWPALHADDERLRLVAPEFRAVVTANRDRRFALTLELSESDVTEFLCDGSAEPSCRAIAGSVTHALQDAAFTVDATRAQALLLPKRMSACSLALIASGAARPDDRMAMYRLAVTAAVAQAVHETALAEAKT
ncbi:MAG: hypothetical protein M3R44_03980 [Candidatus Eremiobacteraeota bacterium]|nr:hypothetical protein [Candidatus Eremiobacteraeota bacterium]